MEVSGRKKLRYLLGLVILFLLTALAYAIVPNWFGTTDWVKGAMQEVIRIPFEVWVYSTILCALLDIDIAEMFWEQILDKLVEFFVTEDEE